MHAPLARPYTRIPVTIVTGFLGSGKTTLLSSLLRRATGERFAVIVNEFGEVPLDQAFIDAAGGKVVTLAGGCLCCAITGDIATTLLALHESRGERAFDRVVIETSGLADPGPLSQDILDSPELTPLFRLDGVICVVDGLQDCLSLKDSGFRSSRWRWPTASF
jgi:G3E family GTPase